MRQLVDAMAIGTRVTVVTPNRRLAGYLRGQFDAAQQLAGSLGPFEIAAARQRGTASLRYALGESLGAWGAQPVSTLVVSFRRAGGVGRDGPLIRIGSVRLRLAVAHARGED